MWTRIKIYLLPLLFITSWWSYSFHAESQAKKNQKILFKPNPIIQLNPLSPLVREELHQALTGDFTLMCQLIAEWDEDAEKLESKDLRILHRLSSAEIKGAFQALRTAKRKKEKDHCYFPQSYFSASLILALVEPEWITALPRGFKEQDSIYPKTFTAVVNNICDTTHIEHAIGKLPTLIFSAPYSHPTTLTSLKERGAALITFPSPTNFDELDSQIEQVGILVNEEERAKILRIFIKAARYSLQNRLYLHSTSHPSTLFAEVKTVLNLPPSSSLISHFLELLSLDNSIGKKNYSDTPIEIEEIVKHSPATLILSMSEKIDHLPTNLQALTDYPIKIYHLNYELEQTLSQFSLLTFFDLCSILLDQPS